MNTFIAAGITAFLTADLLVATFLQSPTLAGAGLLIACGVIIGNHKPIKQSMARSY